MATDFQTPSQVAPLADTAPRPLAASSPEVTLMVSLATAPFLLGLLGSRALETLIQELGKASEELFRGDRLPVLPLRENG
jgi:hypothetical protein